MSEVKIASRYAKSLFDQAVESGTVDNVASDIRNLNEVSAGSADFRLFLQSPLISRSVKKEALKKIFGSYHALTRDLFALMADKGREGLIAEMGHEFTRIYNKANGIAHAEVTSAVALGKDTIKKITEFVRTNTGAKEVIIDQKTDSKLIGGLTIMFEGRIYDSSVLGQINKMKKELNIA